MDGGGDLTWASFPRMRLEVQRVQRAAADRLPAVRGRLRPAGRGLRGAVLAVLLQGRGPLQE